VNEEGNLRLGGRQSARESSGVRREEGKWERERERERAGGMFD